MLYDEVMQNKHRKTLMMVVVLVVIGLVFAGWWVYLRDDGKALVGGVTASSKNDIIDVLTGG